MSQLVPHRPQALRSVFGLGREFERALEEMFDNAWRSSEMSAGTWMPPVDIRTTDEAIQVWVDLPGMTKEDVDIRLEGNLLTIAGERKLDERAQNENWVRCERVLGRFERSFALPAEMEHSKAEATYHDGVLHISIPRAEAAKPRRLQIKAG